MYNSDSVKRKLVKQGRNALTITLPSGWLKENSLESGDEIEINISDNGLLIGGTPVVKDEDKSISFESINEGYIMHIIRNYYYYGFTKINVVFDDPATINIISEAVKRCMGYEIVEQSNNKCIISSVSMPNIELFSPLEKRMFSLLFSLTKIVFDDFRNDEADVQKVSDIVFNIIRYCTFCRMVVTKTTLFNKRESILRFNLYSRVHHIANNLKYMVQYQVENRSTVDDDLLAFFEGIKNQIKMLFKAYSKGDIAALREIYRFRKDSFNDLLPGLIEKNRKRSAMLYYYMADIARTVSAMGGTVANLKSL